jgi:hypothetical protein
LEKPSRILPHIRGIIDAAPPGSEGFWPPGPKTLLPHPHPWSKLHLPLNFADMYTKEGKIPLRNRFYSGIFGKKWYILRWVTLTGAIPVA